MNSLDQLEHILAVRRRRGEQLTGNKNIDKLEASEVQDTNLEVGLFNGGQTRRDISQHLKDIEYTKKWYIIYQAFKDQKLVPGRVILLALISYGEDRMYQLEDKLEIIGEFEYDKSSATRTEYHPKIDLLRWKIYYYAQTVSDGEAMLKVHDEETMQLDRPMDLDTWTMRFGGRWQT
ncbi:hypothetical protein TWF281_002953 [Arthrobotrys megalospora]